MGRNDEFVADFGKDPTVAMSMVENWRNTESISVPSKNKKTRKPATNYGAKNGNSKENPAWATNRNNPKSPNYKSRGM